MVYTILIWYVHWNYKVVKAVKGRIPVFLDGGVRRGTDVFKALALGASGVFVSSYIYEITLLWIYKKQWPFSWK